MKKGSTCLLLIIMCSLFPSWSNAQDWQPLGSGLTINKESKIYTTNLQLLEDNGYLYFLSDYYQCDFVWYCFGCWNGKSWVQKIDYPKTNGQRACGLVKYNDRICVGIDSAWGSFGIDSEWILSPLSYLASFDENLNEQKKRDTINGDIEGLAMLNNKLLLSGKFKKANDTTTFYSAYWTGKTLAPICINNSQKPFNKGGIYTVFGDKVLFMTDRINADRSCHLYSWDGQSFSKFQPDIDFNFVDTSNGHLFGAVKTGPHNYMLYELSGDQWIKIAGSIDDEINCVYYDNGTIYVGGNFTEISGHKAQGIAKWDGANWHPVGFALNNVEKILTYNGVLYAFQHPDKCGYRLAKWNGQDWVSVGSLISGYFSTYIFQNTLYIYGPGLRVGNARDVARITIP